jgi:hypothetical protein
VFHNRIFDKKHAVAQRDGTIKNGYAKIRKIFPTVLDIRNRPCYTMGK